YDRRDTGVKVVDDLDTGRDVRLTGRNTRGLDRVAAQDRTGVAAIRRDAVDREAIDNLAEVLARGEREEQAATGVNRRLGRCRERPVGVGARSSAVRVAGQGNDSAEAQDFRRVTKSTERRSCAGAATRAETRGLNRAAVGLEVHIAPGEDGVAVGVL